MAHKLAQRDNRVETIFVYCTIFIIVCFWQRISQINII